LKTALLLAAKKAGTRTSFSQHWQDSTAFQTKINSLTTPDLNCSLTSAANVISVPKKANIRSGLLLMGVGQAGA